MRILVVNDDGINAKGIKRLAEAAKEFGEVVVCAPEKQCSGMSQRIHIVEHLTATKIENYDVKGVEAWSVGGSPADCVKVAVCGLMKDRRPDYVFSGINRGYNAGIEVCYSGTIGATMEALIKEIPAIAFSCEYTENYDTLDAYISEVIREILSKEPLKNEVWNINFPGCKKEECKGILRDRIPSNKPYCPDIFKTEDKGNSTIEFSFDNFFDREHKEDTDFWAVENKYISIGKIKNMVLHR